MLFYQFIDDFCKNFDFSTYLLQILDDFLQIVFSADALKMIGITIEIRGGFNEEMIRKLISFHEETFLKGTSFPEETLFTNLNSGNGLAAGTLLNTDMAESLARALVLFKFFESV